MNNETTTTNEGGQGELDYNGIKEMFTNIPATREKLQAKHKELNAVIESSKAELVTVEAMLKQLGRGPSKRPSEAEIAERTSKVLKALKSAVAANKGAGVKANVVTEIVKTQGLSGADVSSSLRKLLEEKKITSEGQSRAKTYQPAKAS